MAPLIKREMDKRYSPTWHVFIGKVRCARPLPARALLIAGSAPSRCIPAIVDAGGRAQDFGANVTHENKSFISFILGPLSFLVFKSG